MTFLAVMENRTVAIDQQLSSKWAQLVTIIRHILKSIAATVIFCGRQGIALRGHRDDGVDVLDDNPGRHGNFQALLRFRIDAGDEVLKDHMKTAGGRALYTSKETQNELIMVCSDIIRRKILHRVQAAHFFSIIADEATDSGNEEQLSISTRFLDQDGLSERFLGSHSCQDGITGETIAKGILSQLSEWQVLKQVLWQAGPREQLHR